MAHRSSVSPDPDGLKALSHPGRLRILGLLRTEGPATATTLAARLGLNSGATSYHLRQLHKHGFVVEDEERGTGRDRWWRAAHDSTRTTFSAATPEEHDTYDAYLQAVAIVYAGQVQRSLEELRRLPQAWQDASDLSDWNKQLTPTSALALVQRLHEVVEEWPDEPDEPEAALFRLNLNAFLRPGTLLDDDTPDDTPDDAPEDAPEDPS